MFLADKGNSSKTLGPEYANIPKEATKGIMKLKDN